MIPTNVLCEILERLGYEREQAINSSIYGYAKNVNGYPSVIVFQEMERGKVAIEFVLKYAKIWGNRELAQELETVERRLRDMNS